MTYKALKVLNNLNNLNNLSLGITPLYVGGAYPLFSHKGKELLSFCGVNYSLAGENDIS